MSHYKEKEIEPYVELQYPVVSLSRGSKILPRFVKVILLKSCSIDDNVVVVEKKQDFASEPHVFYVIINGDVHGECRVELDGLVTYNIVDGYISKVDGMIRVNLVHALSDFIRIDKEAIVAAKKVAGYGTAGVLLALSFIWAVILGVSGLVKGIILGLAFCCFAYTYWLFVRVGKTSKRR